MRDVLPAMSEIIPGLWQGDQSSGVIAAEQEFDVVVNLTPTTMGTQRVMKPGSTYIRWEIADGPLPDLVKLQSIAYGCGVALKAKRAVLVHCAAGINRSGLMCALIVRGVERCSGADAVAIVRTARPGALSNKVFADWLQTLDPPAHLDD